ncbi:MAG: PQQ-like beta-propeller repeat protein [Bryobacterales bacterium]|nr:PQQ-like beta-propeller repeat protein [Bryobacterales bacterium]
MPWLRSLFVLVLASVLLPPIGLVLLWLRATPLRWKFAGSVAIAVISVAHLYYFWGLRWERDGGGIRPIFSFGDQESRARALEESRAAMHTAPEVKPAPEPAAVQASTPAPAASATAPTDFWTDFRGPDRLGHYSEKPILTNWPGTGLHRLWKQPIGGGYASFVIAGGLAYTIEQRRDEEFVSAYDAATGRDRWTDSWRAHFSESMGGDGPRSTPVYDSGRLYALGAEGEFRCLDARTGKVIWRKNILEENGASNLMWAQSSSPLIVDNKVIVLPGGANGKSVVAYDKLTGAPIWASQNDEQSYTAPMLVTLNGKRQVLVVSAVRAMGLDPESGELLWDYPWVTEYNINAAQPIVAGTNRFFISAGYGHGAALVEVTPSGSKFQAKTVWQNIRMKNKFNSSVLFEDHVYGLDEAILACIDVRTGEQKWKGGRYGYGQLLLAGSHLVVLTEQGDVVLVKADPSGHQELARFSAIEGKTWNNPAIANGILFVRNTTEMAAFRIAQ